MYDFETVQAGLRNGEFFLEYLPIVELDTLRCVGAEALSRWQTATGIVQPADFLPVMEDTSLSGYLCYWVVEQIARDFLDWLRVHDAFISFNAPPEIFGRGGLFYAADKAGLLEVRHKIVVEVVERGVPDRIGIDALNRAAEHGMRLALDDVGTIGTNIIVFSRCRVEMIKIDRQIIDRIRPGEPLPPELTALIPLVESNNFKIIVEGVETEYQYDVLKSIGVRLAQGFYFSRPLVADAFKTWFTASHPA